MILSCFRHSFATEIEDLYEIISSLTIQIDNLKNQKNDIEADMLQEISDLQGQVKDYKNAWTKAEVKFKKCSIK